MAIPEDPLHQLLLDPDYWKPRLEKLEASPPSVVRIPREDLSRPGVEVLELRLRAHDGTGLRALLAHSTYTRSAREVHLRTCRDFETCALDFGAVSRGTSDVVFPYPPDHRIEDRVLDLLRLTTAVSRLEHVDEHAVELYCGCRTRPDEFRVADLLRDRTWD
ncbi:MAG TPA: hypothetical protein ENJ09_09780 [Planctomycetes bacterium]|nr:hypothetical protein [Planctomycetota bacterium]